MMRSIMQLSALLTLLLWSCVSPSAAIAPSSAVTSRRSPALPFQIPQQFHEASNRRSLLTKIRDEIVTLIWDPSHKHRSHNCSQKPDTSSTLSPPLKTIARYGGDVVLRFRLKTAYEVTVFSEAANVLFLDIWEFTNEFVDVRIAKDVVPLLLGLLPASLRNAHTPLMHDLAQAIYESYPSTGLHDPILASHEPHRGFSPEIRSAPNEANIFFQNYQPLSVIVPWMRLLQSLFPTHVRLTSIGTTYEGRDILAFRVGVHPTNSDKTLGPRKTIIVAGGSHAREWISISTVNYAAFSFITSYGKLKHITKLTEEFDWIFIPTLNPDGYVYSWENDRLWRKNRQKTDLRFCKGLDLDRTWGFQWDGDATKSNPCSESFSGDGPFQGFESRQFADWVQNETEHNNAQFFGFLDFHSYSQQVLYPYSYSCVNSPPSLENLEELAAGLAKAIRHESGEIYGVTSACEGSVSIEAKNQKEKDLWPRIENGGGSALDWFYHEANVKYAFQIKLRDKGSYGFLLPPKNIIPTGKEAFSAITYFGNYMLGNKGIEHAESMQDITSHRPTTINHPTSRPVSLFNVEDLSVVEPTNDMNGGDDEEISNWEL